VPVMRSDDTCYDAPVAHSPRLLCLQLGARAARLWLFTQDDVFHVSNRGATTHGMASLHSMVWGRPNSMDALQAFHGGGSRGTKRFSQRVAESSWQPAIPGRSAQARWTNGVGATVHTSC
jgi:hypothetical protein